MEIITQKKIIANSNWINITIKNDLYNNYNYKN